jgi:hypothetical protein
MKYLRSAVDRWADGQAIKATNKQRQILVNTLQDTLAERDYDQLRRDLRMHSDVVEIKVELPRLRHEVEAIIGENGRLRAVVTLLVADPRAGVSKHEAGTCIYCGYSPYEDEDLDWDTEDGDTPPPKQHDAGCPIERARSLLAQRNVAPT